MASSETEICNSALIKLGLEPILSLSDDSKRARFCAHQYPILRDAELRSHPWNFAIARKELAKTTTDGVFEFTNQFVLPSDVLRILKTNLNLDGGGTIEEKWQVETDGVAGGRLLVTNDTAVKIRYIKKITDVALFTSDFAEVLAWRLAADLAYSLVQSVSLGQQMFAAYEQFARRARSFDAQEGSVDQVESFEWLDSRL